MLLHTLIFNMSNEHIKKIAVIRCQKYLGPRDKKKKNEWMKESK